MQKLFVIGALCVPMLVSTTLLPGCLAGQPQVPLSRRGTVGRIDENRYELPNGQELTPAGRLVELPGMRPQALALSPDGKLLATAGKNNQMVIIDPGTGRVLQSVRLTGGVSNTLTATLSMTGLMFSPNGRYIYLSNPAGNVWAFPVDSARRVGAASIFPVPNANAPKQKNDIPAG